MSHDFMIKIARENKWQLPNIKRDRQLLDSYFFFVYIITIYLCFSLIVN